MKITSLFALLSAVLALGAQGQAAPTPAQNQVQDQAARQRENLALVKVIQQRQTYPTVKIAQEKLKQNSNDAEAHRTLAEHYGTQVGQFPAEMRERREAIRCNPDNPYDIVELASMERFVNHAESARLLTGVMNGHYSDKVRQDARGLLAFIQTHPKPS